MKAIKQMFALPSPEVMAQRELETAKRSLLQAETDLEWAQARVQANRERVARLNTRLQEGIK